MHREDRPEERDRVPRAPARNRLLAGAITAAVIGLILWSGLRGGAPGPTDPGPIAPGPSGAPEPPSPFADAEARLRDLLDRGHRGDVPGYLAGFTGALRDRLERAVRERGRDGFADDLRRAADARKSHAIFAAEPEGPDACRIVVEAVYPDRNERQTYRLEQTPSGWLVAAVEGVRSRSPAEKYGSPAGFVGPEGLPVPVAEPWPE
ncbi:MAG TPA: hypothetical protein VFF52_24840 [Isosphaeraceae bacterium]|nr:hypothetical protein [Isosphaeraceae bacterium]